MRFLDMRNMLMERHGWGRRVATLATRLYLGVDTPADWASADVGGYGRSIISQSEYRMICQAR